MLQHSETVQESTNRVKQQHVKVEKKTGGKYSRHCVSGKIKVVKEKLDKY